MTASGALHPTAYHPLLGRNAFVTGGSRRIGRGICLALAQAGANVVLTYQHSKQEAETTAGALEECAVYADAVHCDLYSEASVRSAVEAGAKKLGGSLDILVNNAGRFETAALESVTGEQWDSMFATNTRAPLLVAQAALPWLRASTHTGRIINLGSLGGLHPWATHAHYCASKAALHMLTQTMAKAWAPQVAVNCVAPGMIVTGTQPDEAYAHFAGKTPMQRNGRVDDVAEVVVFLAASTPFLTGQVIAIDGGLGL